MLNLPYEFDKLKFGVNVRQYVSFWRTTLGVGYARENIKRDFREAATDENTLEASLRTRPMAALSFSATYLLGDRKSDEYNYKVTSEAFWYTFQEATTNVDNPQFLFANHPDLRRYDVGDRQRSELKLSATYIATENLDVSASYRYRSDDFGSAVKPVAPLAGTAVPLPNPADANALTPGQQLGLLRDKRQNASVLIQFTPAEYWTISAFADREWTAADQRGIYFNLLCRLEVRPWKGHQGLHQGKCEAAFSRP